MDPQFQSDVDKFKPIMWFNSKLISPDCAPADHRHSDFKSEPNDSDKSVFKGIVNNQFYSTNHGFAVTSKVMEDDEKQMASLVPTFDATTDNSDIPPLQQSDLMKPLLLDIGKYGLNHAYWKYYQKKQDYKCTKTKHPRRIVIIGAGPAGLAAGYELKRVGHDVVLLEMQHRVGGRVKTIGDSHFYRDYASCSTSCSTSESSEVCHMHTTGSALLWSDAGAMRLPGEGDPDNQPSSEASHFMVDFYSGKDKFNIPKMPFINDCKHGYYKFYGTDKIEMTEWDSDANGYCDHYWPGWDSTIQENVSNLKKENIVIANGIGDYFTKSVNPIIGQLHKWISKPDEEHPDASHAWSDWVQKWSRWSVNDFLTSTLEQIKMKLAQNLNDYDPSKDDDEDLKALQFLLPWPIKAVVAFTTFSYIVDLDISLVELLRDQMGKWWKPPMHTFTGGLQMLPWSFVQFEKNGGFQGDDMDLSKSIIFGAKAHTIKYTAGTAIVSYCDQSSGKDLECVGDAVIITLPVHIIRQLKFNPPLPAEYCAAIENIRYSPSTKIMLQCRERFWEKERKINGGFSKTNMPIGQLHYPSNPDFKIPRTERGILMCYTWKQEALLFGSQSSQDAIAEAVREIEEIHPEIREYFEVGAVQAWYSDPTSQGAFGLLKPMQYLATEYLMDKPLLSVYFAGEAISHTNGWIQGALVSGLRAAFQFYTDNEIKFK